MEINEHPLSLAQKLANEKRAETKRHFFVTPAYDSKKRPKRSVSGERLYKVVEEVPLSAPLTDLLQSFRNERISSGTTPTLNTPSPHGKGRKKAG